MEAAGNAAGAAIKDKENKAKDTHMDKITASEELCKTNSRAAVANATALHEASIHSRESQMDLQR
jgi:hypothetical protein